MVNQISGLITGPNINLKKFISAELNEEIHTNKANAIERELTPKIISL